VIRVNACFRAGHQQNVFHLLRSCVGVITLIAIL
jgi:hypothetical protein